MKQQDINIIIERFLQGDTSLQEESVLKDFLKSNTDEQYNDLRLQFQMMKMLIDENDHLDDSFDEKLLKNLSKAKPIKHKRYTLRTLSGVAATIVIFISIWTAINLLNPKEVYGTINDPKAAFAEAKMIFQNVSKNVEKGIKPVTKTVKKAKSGLDKSKKVGKVKKLSNTGLLLKSMTKVKINFGKS